MPSSVPDVKDGLADYLASFQGLRPSDGVAVNSASIAPNEANGKDIVLGDVTAPQAPAGLQAVAESATMTCWIWAVVPGNDEVARRAARRAAYDLLALVERAVAADRTAQGSVPAPGGLAVGEGSLVEDPTDPPPGGTAGRRADLRFTITWTSHLA